jgi:hypothetical protein
MSERFFIGGLSRNITEKSVIDYFQDYGRGIRLSISRDKNGKSLGYGWLDFDTVDAEQLLQDSHKINGTVVSVSRPDKKTNCSTRSAPLPLQSQQPQLASRPAQSSHSEVPKRGRDEPLRSQPTPSSCYSRPRTEKESKNTTLRETGETEIKDEKYIIEKPMAQWQNQVCVSPSASPSLPATFVCIPLNICPREFLYDPRVFCCTLDPSQVGKLIIIASPSGTPYVSSHAGVPRSFSGGAVSQVAQHTKCNPTYVDSQPGDLFFRKVTSQKAERDVATPATHTGASEKPVDSISQCAGGSLVSPGLLTQSIPPPPGPPPGHNTTVSQLPLPHPPQGPPPSQTPSKPPPPGPPPRKLHVPPPPGPPPQFSAGTEKRPCPPHGPPPSLGCLSPRFIMPPQMMSNPPPPGPPPKR